jgi:hypothetical protein
MDPDPDLDLDPDPAGSGSRLPKNIWIRQIRICNTAANNDYAPELAGDAGGTGHGAWARHIVLAVRLVQERLAPLGRLQAKTTASKDDDGLIICTIVSRKTFFFCLKGSVYPDFNGIESRHGCALMILCAETLIVKSHLQKRRNKNILNMILPMF